MERFRGREAFAGTHLRACLLRNTLKVQRAKHNLTQEQLAELVAVTRKSIYAVENGKYVPSTCLALRLSKVLGVPVEESFQLNDEEGP